MAGYGPGSIAITLTCAHIRISLRNTVPGVEELCAGFTLPPSCVVSAVQTYSSTHSASFLVHGCIEHALHGVSIAVAGCKKTNTIQGFRSDQDEFKFSGCKQEYTYNEITSQLLFSFCPIHSGKECPFMNSIYLQLWYADHIHYHGPQ